MASLEHYIREVYKHEPKYPSQIPRGKVYPHTRSAPRLGNTRLNRIIIYNGSFNPPHRGHLRVLRHTFYHGVHDLNVVGAIIRPIADSSVVEKCRKAGGSFAFGGDERCMLWKQDLCFPDWAWVYEGESSAFSGFLDRLREVAKQDNLEIEYLPLQGPSENDHEFPPGQKAFRYGASTLIINDAARLANYQRSSGFMRDFLSYTKWKAVRFETQSLKQCIQRRMQWTQEATHTICPEEAQDMFEDGAAFVERATSQTLESMLRDFKRITQCERQVNGKTYTIRFVKSERNDSKDWKNYISSTELRQAMSNSRSTKHLKMALDELALSADILWDCRSQWLEKAVARKNELITLDLLSTLCSRGRSDRFAPHLSTLPLLSLKTDHPLSEGEAVQGSRRKSMKRKRAISRASSLPPTKILKMSDRDDGNRQGEQFEETEEIDIEEDSQDKSEEEANSQELQDLEKPADPLPPA
ncbi:MAG: hypothetical protein Q9201_007178 [Fulgogasparrea decipioides]